MIKHIIFVFLITALAPTIHAQEFEAGDQVLKVYDIQNEIILSANSIIITDDWSAQSDPANYIKVNESKAFANIIFDFISPPLDPKKHQLKVVEDGYLIVRASMEHHQWIESFLTVQRTAKNIQFLIEMKWYSLEHEAYKSLRSNYALLVTTKKNPVKVDDGYNKKRFLQQGRGGFTFQKPGEVEAILKDIVEKKNAFLYSAPSVIVTNREKAEVSTSRVKSYLTDYKVFENVEPNKGTIVDPVITQVKEGWRLEMKAVQLQNNMIGLTIAADHKETEHPVKEISTKHGPVSKPKVLTRSMSSKFIMLDNKKVVYSSLPPEAIGKSFILVLKVKKISEKEMSNMAK